MHGYVSLARYLRLFLADAIGLRRSAGPGSIAVARTGQSYGSAMH